MTIATKLNFPIFTPNRSPGLRDRTASAVWVTIKETFIATIRDCIDFAANMRERQALWRLLESDDRLLMDIGVTQHDIVRHLRNHRRRPRNSRGQYRKWRLR